MNFNLEIDGSLFNFHYSIISNRLLISRKNAKETWYGDYYVSIIENLFPDDAQKWEGTDLIKELPLYQKAIARFRELEIFI